MGDSLDTLLGLGPDSGDEGRQAVSSGDEGPQLVSSGPAGDAVSDGLADLAVSAIRPNPYQPRVDFDEEELEELAASITELGVLQPVIVRHIDGGQYELVAGERRWRAAQRAGLVVIPAIVRSVDDRASLEQAVVENLHRADLNVLEEASAYRQLVDEFSLTQEEVALRVGKSRAAVANTMRLLQLPGSVQRLVRAGELSAGHARALLAFPDSGMQAELAVRVVKEGLSVREVEDLARAASRGGPAEKAATVRRSDSKAASVLEIERLLADRLDTRVEVSLAGLRGRVVIEFADLEDLDRVYRLLVGESVEG
jgi:ParB family transcriptional regulator, chromosome partitioning protein